MMALAAMNALRASSNFRSDNNSMALARAASYRDWLSGSSVWGGIGPIPCEVLAPVPAPPASEGNRGGGKLVGGPRLVALIRSAGSDGRLAGRFLFSVTPLGPDEFFVHAANPNARNRQTRLLRRMLSLRNMSQKRRRLNAAQLRHHRPSLQ